MASSNHKTAKLHVNEISTVRRGADSEVMPRTVALGVNGFGSPADIRKRTHRGRPWRKSLASLLRLERDPYP
jgi:hypothetical protein